MNKYVALIRGIGPGDPRKTNDKLRSVLEKLGLAHVESVISSGNIVFESDQTDPKQLEEIIEAAWPKMLGFWATTIVKSQAQLQAIIDSDPFDGAVHSKGSYLLVTFFKRANEPNFSLPFNPPGKPYTIVKYINSTLYSITDNTAIKTSDLMTWIEKQFGKENTSRTPLTLQRILKRMEN